MRKFLVAGIAAIALAGCEISISEGTAIEKGQEMVASALKDPGSALFDDVFMVEEQAIGETRYGYLCGSVNAKNSMGGRTGFRRFAANFNYSPAGHIEVGDIQLEEGVLAKPGPDGISYFDSYYWTKRCQRSTDSADSTSR